MSSTSSNNCLNLLYKKYSGGRDLYIGGAMDLKDYLNSPGSETKKKLIYDIAKDFYEKMKFKEVNPEGKSLDQIIADLKEKFPCPDRLRGNNKTFSSLSSNQINACKVMGEILNEKFANQIINLNDDPDTICNNVCEVIYSLFVGFHKEFAFIKDDVSRILKNITILEEYLERNYRATMSQIKKTDVLLKPVLQEAHNDAMEELHRQQKILENILNVVITPSQKDLDVLLKETNDFKGFIKKIKNYPPGTDKFAEKIAFTTDLFANTAAIAKVVNDALEKVGLSINEYANIKNSNELKSKIDTKLQEILNKKSFNELYAYIRAADILYSYEYLHDNIVQDLQKKGSYEDEYKDDYEDDYEDEYKDDYEDNYTGGNDNIVGGLKLDKRLQKSATLKRAVLRAFNERLSSLMNVILIAGKSIADYIGSNQVQLTDNLDKFVRALDELPDIQKKYVYLALSGYSKDIESKQDREKYLSSVKYVIHTINVCIEDKEYAKIEAFKDMKKGFEELVKLIEDFSTKFEEGFGPVLPGKGRNDYEIKGHGEDNYYGGVDSHIKNSFKKLAPPVLEFGSELMKHGSRYLSEKANTLKTTGHGEDNFNIDDLQYVIGGNIDDNQTLLPEIAKVGYMLDRAKDIIRYNFRTARIRENLNKFNVEIKSYGEDYIKILADAIASAVDNVNIEKSKFIKPGYENQDHVLNSLYINLTNNLSYNGVAVGGAPILTPKVGREFELGKQKFLKIQEFIGKEFDTKIELYRIAEAVDLYMKKFAEAISTNPDDIKDLLHILNTTEIISKWFTEKSGDFLCNVFDTFPTDFIGEQACLNRINNSYEQLQSYHYYLRVAAILRIGNRPGIFNKFPEFAKNRTPNWVGWPALIGIATNDNVASSTVMSQDFETAVNDPGLTTVSYPGLPYLGIPVINTENNMSATQLIKELERSLSVSVLKNIISMFINIGRKFGGKELDKNLFMSPIQIYRGLMNYMIYGSINFGISDPTGATVPDVSHIVDVNMRIPVVNDNRDIYTFTPDGQIRLGLSGHQNLLQGQDVLIYEKRQSYVTLRSTRHIFDINMRDIFGKNSNNSCDTIFTMIIKSIVSKVLTTIGVYNIFHKPINKNGLGYQSSLRLILGGDANVPKIIPEAIELYIRLPLLAEFYRTVFNLSESQNENIIVNSISLIPEFDNIFSGLISIIFDKAKYVKEGEYSTSDIISLIEEINKIYNQFSSNKNPINSCINEFVADVNRRYGIIKDSDREKYLTERKQRFEDKYTSWKNDELTDFELSGIDENDDITRPSPSMSYQSIGNSMNSYNSHKYHLQVNDDLILINDLRNRINKLFKEAKDYLKSTNSDLSQNQMKTLYSKISFTSMINSRREELKYAKSDKEKFDIVHMAINSLSQFSLSATEKSFILFHEIVVYPLNNLQSILNILQAFENNINQCYDCVVTLDKWCHSSGGGSVPAIPAANMMAFGYSTVGPGGFVFQGDDSITNKLLPFVNNWYINNAAVLHINNQHISVHCVAVENCRQGLAHNSQPRNLSYALLSQITYYLFTNNREKDAEDLLWRFAIHQGKLFMHLFQTIFTEVSSFLNLVELKMDVEKAVGSIVGNISPGDTCTIFCHIDHSKLFKNVLETFNTIKNNVDKFRGLIPNEYLDKYLILKSEEKGTLYYIEKYLINNLIHGKRVGTNSGDFATLDNVNQKIKKVLEYLTKPWDFNIRGFLPLAAGPLQYPADFRTVKHLLANGNSNANGATPNISFHEFDREIDTLVYYNPFFLGIDGNIAITDPIWHHFTDLRAYNPEFKRKLNIRTPVITNLLPGGKKYCNLPARSPSDLESILFNTSDKIKNGVKAGAPWGGVPEYRYTKLYETFNPENDGATAITYAFDHWITGKFNVDMWYDDNYRSLLLIFNRLIAAYIRQVYDYNTKKVYSTTINNFANGSFSAAVMNNKNFNDRVLEPINDILNQPDYQGVLFRTLAIILRQFLTEIDDKGIKKQYLETDLNEIPLFLKERMKANLPIFHRMFTMLIKRAEMLKHFTKGLNVAQYTDLAVVLPQIFSFTPEYTNRRAPSRTRRENEKNICAVIEQIIQGSISIIQCIKETLNELASNSKYLETYQNFINIYENENGQYPFMPISSIAYSIRNMNHLQVVNGDNNITRPFLPQYDLGDIRFKLLYATQKVLNSEIVKLDDVPGMRNIIKQHNNSVDSRHHFDEKDLEKFIQNTLLQASSIINFRHYANIMNVYYAPADVSISNTIVTNLVSTGSINFTNLNLNAPEGNSINKLVYQAIPTNSLTDVINLTESAFQKEQKSKIIDIIKTENGCPNRINRHIMLIFNIIDLNIVPINLHALMREVPLINLMNYSNTFDNLITELLGINIPDTILNNLNNANEFILDINHLQSEPNKMLLGLLLIDPYLPITYKVYDSIFAGLVRGNIGISGLGRPKYIGDEIYNKSLFGEIYPGEVYKEEGGPPVGEGHLRGKQEVLIDRISNVFGNSYPKLVCQIVLGTLGCISGLIIESQLQSARRNFYFPTAMTNMIYYPNPNGGANVSGISIDAPFVFLYFYINWLKHQAGGGGAYANPERTSIIHSFLMKIVLNPFEKFIKSYLDSTGTINRYPTNNDFNNLITEIMQNFTTEYGGALAIPPAIPATVSTTGGFVYVETAYNIYINNIITNPPYNNNMQQFLEYLISQIITVAYFCVIPFFTESVKNDLYFRFSNLLSNQGFVNLLNDHTNLIAYIDNNTPFILLPILNLIIQTLNGIDNSPLNGRRQISFDLQPNGIPTLRLERFNTKILGTYNSLKNNSNILESINPILIHVTSNSDYPRYDLIAARDMINGINILSPLIIDSYKGVLKKVIIPAIVDQNVDWDNADIGTRNTIKRNNKRYFPASLHFLQLDPNTNETKIKEVNLNSSDDKEYLQYLGYLRFHTIFARNLIWLTNVQRILRLKLRKDLSWYDTKVVKDLAVSDPSITELYGNVLHSKNFEDVDEL